MDARDWDARYRGSHLVWSDGPNRFVEAHTAELTPGTALDVAAGEGRNALWLAERGWRVTAIDFSEVAVQRGRKLAAERGLDLTWRVADVTTMELGKQRYDLVVVSYLHLPLDQLAGVHRRAATAVAPGGTLVVVGHDRTNLDHGHGGPQDPQLLLEPAEVAGRLADVGLEVELARRVTRPVETDAGQRSAIDTLVVARRPADEVDQSASRDERETS